MYSRYLIRTLNDRSALAHQWSDLPEVKAWDWNNPFFNLSRHHDRVKLPNAQAPASHFCAACPVSTMLAALPCPPQWKSPSTVEASNVPYCQGISATRRPCFYTLRYNYSIGKMGPDPDPDPDCAVYHFTASPGRSSVSSLASTFNISLHFCRT